DIIVTEDIDVGQDIHAMSRTGAYAFYYRLGKNIDSSYMTKLYHHPLPNLIGLGHDLYTWEFQQEQGEWAYPQAVDFTIFRKRDLKKDFEEMRFTYPNELEGRWVDRANMRRMGLCHAHSKMINIPMNVVTGLDAVNEKSFTIQELNAMFSEG